MKYTFGDLLAQQLRKQGLSQSDLSRAMCGDNTRRGAISAYITGRKTEPSLSFMRECAVALGLREDYFYAPDTAPAAPVPVPAPAPAPEPGGFVERMLVRNVPGSAAYQVEFAEQMEPEIFLRFAELLEQNRRLRAERATNPRS